MLASEIWKTLSAVDVSQKIEKKGKLSYLSWAWAWGELMKHYPNATYVFNESSIGDDGTLTVWVNVTITDKEESVSRDMWLPVMDHRNQAIQSPNARQISDTRMRCLVKCLAMFGLGHYIYAGEDLPEPEAVEEALYNKYETTIATIKNGIETEQYSTAAEAWYELGDDEKQELWRAKSKGGVFTADERRIMQTKEFRESFYGVTNE